VPSSVRVKRPPPAGRGKIARCNMSIWRSGRFTPSYWLPWVKVACRMVGS